MQVPGRSPGAGAPPTSAAGSQARRGGPASPDADAASVAGSAAAPPDDANIIDAPAAEGDDALVGGKRARAPRRTFKETDLLSQAGMWSLYERFQRLPLRRSAGHEASDLAAVMGCYRGWARELFPKQHSSDVLATATRWSGRGVVKTAMAAMRSQLEVPRAAGTVPPTLARYNEVRTGVWRC